MRAFIGLMLLSFIGRLANAEDKERVSQEELNRLLERADLIEVRERSFKNGKRLYRRRRLAALK